jgi:magnesium transporter
LNSAMMKQYTIVERKLVETPDNHCPIVAYIGPDDAEKRHLIDVLKLDEHTLASALDPDELARLEFEPEHAAIIFKRPRNYSSAEQFLFKVSSAGAFLFKDRIVLVAGDDANLFDGVQIIKPPTPGYIILRLISRSIIHFREHLKAIGMISDELQGEINRAMENKHLLNLFTLQKSLVYYVNSLNSNGAVLDRMKSSAAKIGFSTEEMELLDDIIIENGQCFKQAEISSNILAGLMDARASIVSNNLNVLMKTLNIITITIMVPTLVVSIFSMNVGLPLPQERENWPFWFVMGLALVSSLAFLVYWWKRKW